ncbi:MAG TPA: glycoside hydrolase family 27 protein, partial [Xylanibacter oryzae]|nr:glycoside hydrolase family 27 protein [Xylanibacter oryzae]
DIRSMSNETKAILMNKEMIAVNQDKMGIQGYHHSDVNGLQIWFKPLENGDWAITILNPTQKSLTYGINWQNFNFKDTQVSDKSTDFDKIEYHVRNLWLHKSEGKTSKENRVERIITVPSHDVISYRLIK